MKRTAIIMAGGSGERFWPLSRKTKPKQLLNLETDKTMLEQSIERISPLIAPQDIFIITSEVLLEPIREALPMLPRENVFAEPYKRNTAPCLALAAAFIKAKYSNEYKPEEISIAVLTADQSIRPVDGFIATVDSALNYVESQNALGTIGIPPSRPETGYGYIEVSENFDSSSKSPEIKPVLKFHEKPELEKAKRYAESGAFLWNSGMFFWRLDTFCDNLIKCLPEVGNQIETMTESLISQTGVVHSTALKAVDGIYAAFPDISIDYGLMEKAQSVVVARALFDWDDIGSWDSLDRIKQADENGNIVQGQSALHNVKNTTIVNQSSNSNIIVSAIGLEDFVIVVTDDAVLVTPKSRVLDVKKCVELIRSNNGDKWL